MQTRSIFLHTLIWILMATGLAGCCSYGFTGGSTGNAKTVLVDYFPNKASIINPTLSQVFTEKMRDKFRRETRLTQVQSDADFSYSGFISNYTITPAAVQGDAQTTLNRLTISINVKFENKLEPKQNFEQEFSQFADFDASVSVSQVEAQLVDDITNKLIQEVFNRSVNNW
ncbi:MAG: LptE family protein [Bacteroidia bacterium]